MGLHLSISAPDWSSFLRELLKCCSHLATYWKLRPCRSLHSHRLRCRKDMTCRLLVPLSFRSNSHIEMLQASALVATMQQSFAHAWAETCLHAGGLHKSAFAHKSSLQGDVGAAVRCSRDIDQASRGQSARNNFPDGLSTGILRNQSPDAPKTRAIGLWGRAGLVVFPLDLECRVTVYLSPGSKACCTNVTVNRQYCSGDGLLMLHRNIGPQTYMVSRPIWI